MMRSLRIHDPRRAGAMPTRSVGMFADHHARHSRDDAAMPPHLRGFTLIEMVVVIVIILVIVGLVVPAASALWNERKMAEAVNTIQGLLMTTRADALRASGVESGFFAFVDDRGVQRFVSIEQPPNRLADSGWENVFTVTGDRDQAMPAPMRVVPRYVVDDPATSPAPDFELFSKDELANNDFEKLPVVDNQAQRHRNFFTIVYSTDGQLLVNRDVLILDENSNPGSGPGLDDLGDRTGKPVGPGDPNATTDPDPLATTDEYYTRDDTSMNKENIGEAIPFLIRDDSTSDTAINFPSVDGLLVYDDSLFNGITDSADKREFLLRTVQPLYVSRFTGVVIRGPIGENTA